MKSTIHKGFNPIKFTINPNMKDHSNDPFVIRMTNKAKALHKENPFPEHLIKEHKENSRG